VNNDASGELHFDVQALTKLESQLEGNSTARDYVMRVSNSKLGLAPDIQLTGIYRFEGDVATLDYDDLRETPFECQKDRVFYVDPGGAIHTALDDQNAATCKTFRPEKGAEAESKSPGVMTSTFKVRCTVPVYWSRFQDDYDTAKRSYESEGNADDYKRAETQAKRAKDAAAAFTAAMAQDLPAAIASLVKGEKQVDGLCDPTGRMMAAWDGRNFWNHREMLRAQILVFSASTNPLYPAPRYYSQWWGREPETVKNALQIMYLVAQEKARAASP
jgi:hypothetical protein